jgi:hypothetical protein
MARMAGEEDLVQITGSGEVTRVGPRAAHRLQARAGAFQVLPSPPNYVLMKQVSDPSSPARSCILSGEIQSSGVLCDVLSFVRHTNWRGEFIVYGPDDGVSRSIFFEDGNVIASQSAALNERLGEVLYRYGILTREQVDACSEASADGSLRFGEAAVKLQFVTREQLFAHMSRQTEEVFYGMLLASKGTFFFLDSFDPAQLSWRQPLSITTLVREGIRRMHETKYFRARIPSENHVPVRVPNRPPPDPSPLGVYDAIDGVRSIVDLGRVVHAGEFEITRAVFQLIQSGHVGIKPPHLLPTKMVAVYNQAIGLILRELDAMDEGDSVREQLASFVAHKGMASLFEGAGPSDDGTLDGDRIAENLKHGNQGDEHLANSLYDYASYALFLARPHLRRRDEGRTGSKTRFSKRVSELLEPIAPGTKRTPDRGE